MTKSEREKLKESIFKQTTEEQRIERLRTEFEGKQEKQDIPPIPEPPSSDKRDKKSKVSKVTTSKKDKKKEEQAAKSQYELYPEVKKGKRVPFDPLSTNPEQRADQLLERARSQERSLKEVKKNIQEYKKIVRGTPPDSMVKYQGKMVEKQEALMELEKLEDKATDQLAESKQYRKNIKKKVQTYKTEKKKAEKKYYVEGLGLPSVPETAKQKRIAQDIADLGYINYAQSSYRLGLPAVPETEEQKQVFQSLQESQYMQQTQQKYLAEKEYTAQQEKQAKNWLTSEVGRRAYTEGGLGYQLAAAGKTAFSGKGLDYLAAAYYPGKKEPEEVIYSEVGGAILKKEKKGLAKTLSSEAVEAGLYAPTARYGQFMLLGGGISYGLGAASIIYPTAASTGTYALTAAAGIGLGVQAYRGQQLYQQGRYEDLLKLGIETGIAAGGALAGSKAGSDLIKSRLEPQATAGVGKTETAGVRYGKYGYVETVAGGRKTPFTPTVVRKSAMPFKSPVVQKGVGWFKTGTYMQGYQFRGAGKYQYAFSDKSISAETPFKYTGKITQQQHITPYETISASQMKVTGPSLKQPLKVASGIKSSLMRTKSTILLKSGLEVSRQKPVAYGYKSLVASAAGKHYGISKDVSYIINMKALGIKEPTFLYRLGKRGYEVSYFSAGKTRPTIDFKQYPSKSDWIDVSDKTAGIIGGSTGSKALPTTTYEPVSGSMTAGSSAAKSAITASLKTTFKPPDVSPFTLSPLKPSESAIEKEKIVAASAAKITESSKLLQRQKLKPSDTVKDMTKPTITPVSASKPSAGSMTAPLSATDITTQQIPLPAMQQVSQVTQTEITPTLSIPPPSPPPPPPPMPAGLFWLPSGKGKGKKTKRKKGKTPANIYKPSVEGMLGVVPAVKETPTRRYVGIEARPVVKKKTSKKKDIYRSNQKYYL